MDSPGTRLKYIRLKKFGKRGGIAKISKILGIAPTTYLGYERENRKSFEQKTVDNLCRVLGIRPEWLLLGHGPENLGENQSAILQTMPIKNAALKEISRMENSKQTQGSAIFAFMLASNHLEGMLDFGNIVIVDPEKKPVFGQTVLFKLKNISQPACKILANITKTKYTFFYNNENACAQEEIDIEKIEWMYPIIEKY